MSAKARKTEAQPVADEGQDKQVITSQAVMTAVPELNAAGIVESFNIHHKPDILEIMSELCKRANAIVRGDTSGIERMLVAQAHALDSMFASLARRAKNQDNLAPYDAHLKFALRAQAQCRATLETLAAIKNPPQLAFVKQANIAHGPQQVNNGQAQPVARAEENKKPPNELLGNDHGERLDFGKTDATGRGDPVMEAVGAIDGTAHEAGKGRVEPKQLQGRT